MSSKWYVITGGPSSGKTTLLSELEKLGYATVPEAARTWIDLQMAKGMSIAQIRKDEQEFQYDVLRLKQKIENKQSKERVTFFDRGMQDSMAYLKHYNYDVKDWVYQAMDQAKYTKVFLLEPLPVFEEDYARTEGKDFPKQITDELRQAYRDAGMEPIEVPVMPIEDRVKFILQHVEQDATIKA